MSARDERVERAVTALLESDAMTGNHDGTPEHYIVEAENVEYLVGIVADALADDPAQARLARVEALLRLVESTRNLDYDPSQEAWICGEHGIAECSQGTCADLPWPQPNADPVLSEFMDWADAEFRRIVRPYDLSDDPHREMPQEAFHPYDVGSWPIRAALAGGQTEGSEQ